MVLAVEIDNSKINFGIFQSNGVLETNFGITTNITKTADEYAVLIDSVFNYYKVDRENIQGAVLSSVVPMLTNVIYDLIKSFFKNIEVIQVQKGIKTGFSIKVDHPSELGADLVANAVGVIEIQKSENKEKHPSLIVDIDTVSTIFALNDKNEFIGGSIFPGIEMSINSLHGKTAQLPNVTIVQPTKVIGKNSQESILSGVIFGTAIMIEGFVEKISREMNTNDINVFITGEYAEHIISLCSSKYRHIPNLTLFGLYCIYKNNANI